MYIERQMSGTLRCVMDEYPIVTVSGPRQSGKTTLVRKCLGGYGYVNLEDSDTAEFARSDPRGFQMDELPQVHGMTAKTGKDENGRNLRLGWIEKEQAMKRFFLFGAMAFAALCATAAEYDVTRYGAKPDGKSDNTAAIQKAIDDCAAKGGGRVLVPGGGKYVTYTLNLKNNVDLHIDRGATLLGGEDPLKYPLFETNDVWNAERAPRFNRRAMFYTVGQTNVAITGAGTIDGNAEKFHHREKRKNGTGYRWRRNSDTNITGRCVFFVGCRDVRLDDVLILHPAGWSTWFLDCDRVGVRGVRIEADRRFPNGDGLHFGGCRDVTVSDCIVNSQDDAFIVRTHQEQMKKPRPCERVVVNNCILNSYSAFAIRIGFRGDGPVRDVSFDNIVSTHSVVGIGFTVPSAPKGEDYDPPRGRGLEPPPPESLVPFSAENFRFSNMSVVCSRPMRFLELGTTTPIAFIKDISFAHCRFKAPGAPDVRCRPQDNVRDWRFSDVVFEVIRPQATCARLEDLFPGTSGFEFDNVGFRAATGAAKEGVRRK